MIDIKSPRELEDYYKNVLAVKRAHKLIEKIQNLIEKRFEPGMDKYYFDVSNIEFSYSGEVDDQYVFNIVQEEFKKKGWKVFVKNPWYWYLDKFRIIFWSRIHVHAIKGT